MLKSRRVSIVPLKFDPYLNVDPGTMSPYQHGEVFVTVDGRETDLDLGHYERFIDVELTSQSNITAGEIYRNLIKKEREGHFLGGTIQTVPHVTDAIQNHMKKLAEDSKADVVVVEVGGTVGDIECQPFLEALRQMRDDPAVENCFYVHLTLMPSLGVDGELKTKPTQHSVQVLRSMGIQPDMILCRADQEVPASAREKISVHCNVPLEHVIGLPTLNDIYQVPIYLEKQGVGDIIAARLGIQQPADSKEWQRAITYRPDLKEVTIALVGKYVELHDSYFSVIEALRHAAHTNRHKLRIEWVRASDVTDTPHRQIGDVNGILVPGGFDSRGIEGMIRAAKYAREHNIPYFGICLGLHIMIIEFARNVLGLENADSVEFAADTPYPVIDLMPEQDKLRQTGGTMRLGSWDCRLVAGTRLREIYGMDVISERHRHRFEVNNQFVPDMEQNGLIVSGRTTDGKLVETCELEGHKFMVGCQFHPEFASRPDRPHPLFREFVRNAIETTQKPDFNIQQKRDQISFAVPATATSD